MNVLYVCVGNSCRSIMAEAMTRTIGRGRIRSCSAGLSPAHFVAEDTLTTLRGLGYPTDGLSSKGLGAVPFSEVDVVVSLLGPSGLQMIPTHLLPNRRAWRVPDPFGEDPAMYQAVARDIEARVRGLVEELLTTEPGLDG